MVWRGQDASGSVHHRVGAERAVSSSDEGAADDAGAGRHESSRKMMCHVLRNLRRDFTTWPAIGIMIFLLCVFGLCAQSLPPTQLVHDFSRGHRAARDNAFLQRKGSAAVGAPDPQAAPGDSAAAVAAEPGPLLVRGVASGVLQQRYSAQRAAGHFECFGGDQRLASFDAVNDDYCDCADGSDEPGTSACAGLAPAGGPLLPGFSCRWGLGDGAEQDGSAGREVIRYSSVNDGICDCCGGQDEWNGLVRCADRCAAVAAEAQKAASRAVSGSKAREAYVRQAASLQAQKKWASVDGGPDGAFIAAAAKGCLTIHDGDSRFEVCLFDKVTQHQGGRSFSLGKKGEWSTSLWENGEHRKDYSKLVMGGGEYCAASSAPRRAEILFECAESPALASVQEAQVCVYAFRLQTPAACHPSHHR